MITEKLPGITAWGAMCTPGPTTHGTTTTAIQPSCPALVEHCAHWEANGTDRGVLLYTQALPQMSVTWQPGGGNFVWFLLEDVGR